MIEAADNSKFTSERILVLTPAGNDAGNTAFVLQQAGLTATICPDLVELTDDFLKGAGALLIAEEALSLDNLPRLMQTLSEQPHWSDVPVILITSVSNSSEAGEHLLKLFTPHGNVTLIERPLRPISLISTLQAALRARRRQYELRKFLEQQQENLTRIQEDERRFRAVFNQQFQLMAILSPEGIVTEVNDLPFKLTGISREDVLGKVFWETPFWENLPEMKCAWPERLTRAAQSKEPVLSFDRYEQRDGGVRIADSAVTAIRDSAGQVEFFIVQASDITERKQAEEALRKSEERYRTLVSQVKDFAIFTMDIDGRITSWNEGVQRVFGYDQAEFIGNNVARDFTPKDVANGVPERELADARKNGTASNDRWMLRKDRTLFWASGVTTSLRGSNGEIIGFTKVLRDLTEQKKMEQELRDSREILREHAEDLEERVHERTAKLQETISELEAFSYSVSHDLRAPLRAMQGYSQFLLEDYCDNLDETGRDYVRRISTAATRLDKLIQDILTYSRVARAEIHTRPIDLEKLFTDVIQSYHMLQRAQIHVRRPLLPVLGHEGSLTQSISNLLGNAVKFVPKDRKAEVNIWTEERDGKIRLNFQDNGIGIAPEYQKRIFNMFEQAHFTQSYEGTGIGLAIVRKAAERMDGEVGVESELGKGSTFWIELPKVEGA
ncbi:MAG: putative two-component sensor histidine kinase protein [Verrucomicrobiales bacterium]|nr:putative two-component sensor histidine kinase protein [Verrucomicrobiales bacterium]